MTTCDNATQDVRVSEVNQGNTGILGAANYRFFTATGHFVTTAPDKPTITLNSFYAGGGVDRNTEVLIHESGHIAGLAHRRGTVMNAVAFGTNLAADAPNLGTIGFLYAHADAATATAGAASARQVSPLAVKDPVMRSLLARGPGAKTVRRSGRTETQTLINRGGGVFQVVTTMYTSEAGATRDVQRQAVDAPTP